MVAAVEGPALGGGLELLLACDIRIGSTSCRVGFPDRGSAIAPHGRNGAARGSCRHRAGARMLLTGDAVSANEAHRVGILQRVCAPVDFSARLDDLIASIVACDSGTLNYLKALLGVPAQGIAAQEAAVAGFTATRVESRERKKQFLAGRRHRS